MDVYHQKMFVRKKIKKQENGKKQAEYYAKKLNKQLKTIDVNSRQAFVGCIKIKEAILL